MKKTNILLLSLLTILTSGCGLFKPKFDLTLHKKANQDFTILQLTDVQIINPYSQPYEGRLNNSDVTRFADKEKNAYRYIRELITRIEPDYIVFTGDNVYGEFDRDGKSFIDFVKLIESFKTPWSLVFGNHDGEYYSLDSKGNRYENTGMGNEWQSQYLMKNTKYCLFDQGDEELGYGNYTVHMLQGKDLFYTFTFLDTHGCRGYSNASLRFQQLSWYQKEMVDTVKYQKTLDPIPNFMFMHIPSKEFVLAGVNQYGFERGGKGVITSDCSINENGDYGKNSENVSYFDNGNFFTYIKDLGNTKGVFCGHDHVNNSSIMYEGVRFTFGLKSSTYDYYDDVGGTVITIKDDKSFNVKPIFTTIRD